MGILIILGIIILSVGIFHKINNLTADKDAINTIKIKEIAGHELKDFYVESEKLILKYKKNDNYIIYIYDIVSGNLSKKIELLK